jgi:hypothetical protein
MPLADITLAQLQAASAAQIRTVITNRINAMTKKQLVALVWSVVAPDDIAYADAPVVVCDKNGQMTSLTEVTRDALGVRTGGRVITWTYYEKTGAVDTITISTRDAADIETDRKVIKHDPSGVTRAQLQAAGK